MRLSDLISLLESTGFPVAYDHFPDEIGQAPPYLAVSDPETINFFADNRAYEKIMETSVRLYAEKKDTEAESAIARVFDSNNIPWQSQDEGFDEDDGVYVTVFFVAGIVPDPKEIEEEN